MTQPPYTELNDHWLQQIEPELLVINKPPGLSVLADRSGAADLWQLLRARFGKLYLVHRLDKATSGLLLVARTQALQSRLTQAFGARQVRKLYVAKVVGAPLLHGTGLIDLPLRKGRKSRYRIAAPRQSIERQQNHWFTHAADPDGLASQTRLRTLVGHEQQTTVAVQPLTGRSHQIRVHLAWIGHPIVGDRLYGKPMDKEQQAQRLMLHAARLRVPGMGAWSAPDVGKGVDG